MWTSRWRIQVTCKIHNQIVWKLPKMSHFNFRHFPSIFVLLKVTWVLNRNVSVARSARNAEWDFLYDFQTQWHIAYCFATANRTTKMMVVVDTTWYPDTVSFFEAWFMIQASPSSLALLCVFCTWASSEIYQSRYIPSDNSFYKKNVDCNYNNVLTTFLTNELFFCIKVVF